MTPSRSPLGLRVNPQVGGGAIEALSTATATSKFGVALRDPGAREWVVRAYLDRPWLTRLHAHTGSQGIPLPLMAEGVRETYALAEEINARAGRRQIDTLDIGGGLPVNFASDATTPTFAEYVRVLREAVPGLFDGRYGLVTEFGRSLLAKHGTVVARVEYAKSAGGRPVAVTHAGVQVATRTVYAPGAWPLRIAAYDAKGRPKEGPAVVQDVAGPACFAGDLLAAGRKLPLLEQGDHVAALDTGRTTSRTTTPTTRWPGLRCTASGRTPTGRLLRRGARGAVGRGDRGGGRRCARRRAHRRPQAVGVWPTRGAGAERRGGAAGPHAPRRRRAPAGRVTRVPAPSAGIRPEPRRPPRCRCCGRT